MNRDTTAAVAVIAAELSRDSDEQLNYQRDALEEALEHLRNNDIPSAVHVLGDAVDHAHRPGWTETRPEVAVCVEAFRLLTNSVRQEGGVA